MPKPIIRAVFKRDFKSWFGNPTGYVFIVLFVFAAALAMVQDQFFQLNLATLDTLTGYFSYLLLFFIPAITMGLWSSERSNGTQELLFTLPARDFQILMGKYLAAAGIYTVALLFTLMLPAGLFLMGEPDIGLLASTYLGYWLVGLMLLSVSMVSGQLTDNLAVSFILGALLTAAVLFSDVLVGWLPWGLGAAWQVYGPTGMFTELTRGVVTPAALLLFLGWTAAFLYLNLALLQRRHVDDTTEFGLHRVIRVAALLAAFVALTIWAVHHLPRADATVEQVHSVSADTGELLKDLNPERPVYVQAYVSDEVPQALVQSRRSLLDLLDQYDRQAGGAVEVRVVPTEPFSEAAEEAAENFNITGISNPANPTSPAYLGFAVQCGPEEVTVPALLPGMSVEYELTRSIRTVANAVRRQVGILKTEVEFVGGMDFQTMQQKPSWPIVEELELQYRVEGEISPDGEYPDDLAVLIVPMVSSLTQPQMDRLLTYIEAGNKVVLLDDPYLETAPGTSATDPKGGPRNPMTSMGQPPPEQKGNIDKFLARLDLKYPYREVVFDRFNPHAVFDTRSRPEYAFLDSAVDPEIRPEPGLSRTSPITKDLDQVVVMFAGHVSELDPNDDLKVEPLLRTSLASGVVSKSNLLTRDIFGREQVNPSRVHREDGEQKIVGCRVTGTVRSNTEENEDSAEAEAEIDVVILADLDMISRQMFAFQKLGGGAALGIRFDNVALILNTIDELAGDRSFIELRSRRPVHRRLEAVEREQRKFNAELLKSKAEAEEEQKRELKEAQARLDNVVKSIQEDPTLDESSRATEIAAARNIEQIRFDRAKSRIENDKARAVISAERKSREQVASVHRKYQLLTLVLAPIPAIALGLLVWLFRMRREAVIVPDSRKMRGAA